MTEGIIGVFIPIIFILVVGLIFVAAIYFRARERQMLIDKGLSADSIKEFFETKKDPYRLLKFGIIAVAFGLGLGFGLMLQDYTDKDYWVVLSLFTLTGIGFIGANLIANKLQAKNPVQ